MKNQRDIVTGMMVNMMMNKAERYKLELPADLQYLAPKIKVVQRESTNRNANTAVPDGADDETGY